jgi:PKD repeat protein
MTPRRNGWKSLTYDSPARRTRSFSAPRSGGSWAGVTFPDSRTYNVSYTIEDDRGGARSYASTITPVNVPPTAAIQAVPASGAAPLLVQFTAVTTDDHLIATYAWTFGDGGSSAAANPSHTFTSAGTYDVTLTVTDDHGATATARYAVVATGAQPIANGGFAGGTSGWVKEGDCSSSSQLIGDDALHGNAFELSFSGGGSCGPTLLWQVAAIDVDDQASVRVRADVKLMVYAGFYSGPVRLKVYAGTSSPYNQTLVGTHVFQPGSFSESHALGGTTTLPVGTWYAFTSDDVKPLFPAGTQFVRVELSEAGAANFGWGRVDNVKVIANDAAAPLPGMTANPTNGTAPLLVMFTGSCSDGDGSCAGFAWDFGDGTTAAGTAGGGSTSASGSPSFTFTGNRTYNVSVTVEDDKGAARSRINSVSTVNVPPSASIQAVPSSGPAPLNVQFTAVASDPDGTIVSWSWNFGDGGTSSAQNPAHVYTTPGTYQVTLTVTDNQGAFTTVVTSIVVT